VLAWLADHPPTPPSAAGSAAAAVGTPVAQSTATRTGRRPVRPSPAGATGASTQRGTGGSGGGSTPTLDASGLPGGRAAWRVAGRGGPIRGRCGCRRWGWWARAGRLGRSPGRWGCTRWRCAAGSGRPGMSGGLPWACRSRTALISLVIAMRVNRGQVATARTRTRVSAGRSGAMTPVAVFRIVSDRVRSGRLGRPAWAASVQASALVAAQGLTSGGTEATRCAIVGWKARSMVDRSPGPLACAALPRRPPPAAASTGPHRARGSCSIGAGAPSERGCALRHGRLDAVG
jgi:hypothetical protein